MPLEIIRNDITKVHVDAIVNSKQKLFVTLPVFTRGSDSLVEFGNEVNKFCLLVVVFKNFHVNIYI